MGLARKVVRKSVRRATPRSVRKVMHPARTARRAVTPRPVRQISRGIYTVTNPLGAAENALIGAALSGGSHRRKRSRTPTKTRRPSSSRAPQSPTVSARAAEGAFSRGQIADLMAVQRQRFQPAARPIIPAPDPVDGRPHYDSCWKARRGEARFWQQARRRVIRAEIKAETDTWVARRAQEAKVGRQQAQAHADSWWADLTAGGVAVVTSALEAAFADNPAPVRVDNLTKHAASLTLLLPAVAVLPDRRPHVTPGGKLSTKPWTKTDLQQTYAELLGAHLLATIRETLAVAPAITSIRVVGRRTADDGHLFDITVARDDNWADDRAGMAILNSADHGLHRVGRTSEVQPWPITGGTSQRKR
jgi:hypothetical protein